MTTRIKCQPGLLFSGKDKKTNSKIYKTKTVGERFFSSNTSFQIHSKKIIPEVPLEWMGTYPAR